MEKFKFLQPISEEIFEKKYNLYNEESPEKVFESIAIEMASAEKESVQSDWQIAFYEEMVSGRLIPAGRILANARPFSKMKNYNNCFTIDVEDSMGGITLAVSEYMLILQMGGGVGFNISKLRPEGAPVSRGGESSGPLSFLEIFNTASKTISVGGGRRGASICILNVDHPDIEKFITYKRGEENNALTQFNISVGITDEFMRAVKNNEPWKLKWGGKVYKTVDAKKLFNSLTYNAYHFNEPGIFNLSEVQKNNNGFYAYDIQECNPCLVGDTKIKTMLNGNVYETKIKDAVAKLERGEKILVESYSVKDQTKEWKEIYWGGLTRENAEVLTIEIENKETLTLTPDHLVYVKDRGWVEAKNLKEGDDIIYTKELETD